MDNGEVVAANPRLISEMLRTLEKTRQG